MNLLTQQPWKQPLSDWSEVCPAASSVTACVRMGNVLSRCFLDKIKSHHRTKENKKTSRKQPFNQPDGSLLLYWKQPCLVRACCVLQFISGG